MAEPYGASAPRTSRVSWPEGGDDTAFRTLVREWLGDQLAGEFAPLRGRGGPGREHEMFELRLRWNRHLAAAGWTCIGWPVEYGGRAASIGRQVIFHEEYAESGAPAKVGHIGEELLGPTLIAFGTPEQRARFLPAIVAADELWCQGYSEPGAGSDLANVSTTAVPDGDHWVITGQKVWTSLAHVADWCFVLARTPSGDPAPGRTGAGTDGSAAAPGKPDRHGGLSYLLVPMAQDGVTVRPIRQLTGTAEFNEVFFDGARTARDLVVGDVGQGWRIAMATLGFERGVATLGQQVGFRRELSALTDLARRNGSADDPVLADRLARAWMGLEVMRAHALRTLEGVAAGTPGPEASVSKLLWAGWHRGLGELAMDIIGAPSMVADPDTGELDEWQRLFLFTRADTIYGGSDEIQRNIIAERVLGLPREVRP